VADEPVGSEAGQQVMKMCSIKHMALDQRVAGVVGQLVCNTTAEGVVGQDMGAEGRRGWENGFISSSGSCLAGSFALYSS